MKGDDDVVKGAARRVREREPKDRKKKQREGRERERGDSTQ